MEMSKIDGYEDEDRAQGGRGSRSKVGVNGMRDGWMNGKRRSRRERIQCVVLYIKKL